MKIKKRLFTILTLALFILSTSLTAFASGDVTVTLDGKTYKFSYAEIERIAKMNNVDPAALKKVIESGPDEDGRFSPFSKLKTLDNGVTKEELDELNKQKMSSTGVPLIKPIIPKVLENVDSTIINGRVFVPLRLISEELGYSVHWDSNTQTVFVNGAQGAQANNSGACPESSNGIRLIINGQMVTTDVAPRIIHNRVMVPTRAIFESLNSIVKWESESKEVLIVQLDELGQDTLRSIEIFLNWVDASYDNPNGTPEDFSTWMTKKNTAIEEGYSSVLNYRFILEQTLTASELENNDLYQLVKEASTLMEYERENVTIRLIHPNAREKLIEIAAKLR